MIKKILIIACFFYICLFTNTKVNASSENYVNSENVKIEYSLYEKLCNIYSENYVEYISQGRFDEIKNNDLSNIKIVEYMDIPQILPFSTQIETGYKTLRIIKNGSNITLLLTWKNMPSTRSYDVIGIRFNGARLNGNIYYEQYSFKDGKSYVDYTNYLQKFSNGFGFSFVLPSGNITKLEHMLEFKYTGSGRIYGTYQHSQKNISLSDSKKYTISSSGLGNVLLFNDNVSSNFDAMAGVYIDV